MKEAGKEAMKPKVGEKGLTLIELLVTISIVAVISAALSMTVITLMRLSPQSRDWNIALRQVQNAGYWISRDVQMSKGAITVGTGIPEFLTLTQPQNPTDNITIVYQFEDMPGGFKRLIRNDQSAGQEIMIAEYIYYNPDDSERSTWVTKNQSPEFAIRIASTYGNATVRRQYEVTQRLPAESP